jgi:hypothetical protein
MKWLTENRGSTARPTSPRSTFLHSDEDRSSASVRRPLSLNTQSRPPFPATSIRRSGVHASAVGMATFAMTTSLNPRGGAEATARPVVAEPTADPRNARPAQERSARSGTGRWTGRTAEPVADAVTEPGATAEAATAITTTAATTEPTRFRFSSMIWSPFISARSRRATARLWLIPVCSPPGNP